MKRQTIYPLFIAALTLITVLDVNAQTKEGNVSEARIRRLLSSQDGNDNKAIQFSGATVTRAQTLPVNPKLEVSPNSPQELRALIFENYTPPGAKGVALRSAATPKQATSGAGADKLPSESAAEPTTVAKQTAAPVQVPPTQGDVKEEQR